MMPRYWMETHTYWLDNNHIRHQCVVWDTETGERVFDVTGKRDEKATVRRTAAAWVRAKLAEDAASDSE